MTTIKDLKQELQKISEEQLEKEAKQIGRCIADAGTEWRQSILERLDR